MESKELLDASELKTYRAFLSYSRRDERAASWLHRALEKYRLPKGLVSRSGFAPSKSLAPIFRDRTDMSGHGQLTERIRYILTDSQALIVLCSPAAARSKFVNLEVEGFLAVPNAGPVIPVILSGEPDSGDVESECLPPALRGRGLYAPDLRHIRQPDGTIIGDGREGGKLKLIATLLDVPLDTVLQRDRQRQRRFLLASTALTICFGIVAATAAFFAVAAASNAELARLNATKASREEAHAKQETARARAAQTEQARQTRRAEAFGRLAVRQRDRAESERRRAEQERDRAERERDRADGERSRAQLAQEEAQDALNRSYAVRARDRIEAGDLAGATRFVLTGLRRSPRNAPEFRDVLSTIMFTSGVRAPPLATNVDLLSPTGDAYVVLTRAGQVQLFDTGGRLRARHDLPPGSNPLRDETVSLAYSGDGSRLAVTRYIEEREPAERSGVFNVRNYRAVSVIDPLTGSVLTSYPQLLDTGLGRPTRDLAYSPDLAHSFDGTVLWHADTNSIAAIDRAQCHPVSYTFSRDSRRLAIGCIDKSIDVVDVVTGARVAQIGERANRGFASGFNPVTFSHSGRQIASAITSSRIQLWTIDSNAVETLDLGTRRSISAIAYSPDDRHIVAGDEAGHIYVVDLARRSVTHTLFGHSTIIRAVRFSGPTTFESLDGSGVARRWSEALSDRVSTIPDMIDVEQGAPRLAISGDGEILASGLGTEISLYRIRTGERIGRLALDRPRPDAIIPIHAMALSHDGSFIIVDRESETSMFESYLDSYDSASGALLGRIEPGGDRRTYYTLALSRDGTRFAVGDISGSPVQIGDLRTGRILTTLDYADVWALAFSPDDTSLAIGTDGGRVHFVRLADAAELRVLNLSAGHVTALAYAPSGRYLAAIASSLSNGLDQSTTVWNIEAQRIVAQRDYVGPLWLGYFSVGFSADESHLLLTAQTNRTDLIDIRHLTTDLAGLVGDACRMQLTDAERLFSALDIRSDPLLQSGRTSADSDVCAGVPGAPPLSPVPARPSSGGRATVSAASSAPADDPPARPEPGR